MNVRPLFWMMVGAVATLVGGAWGGRQPLLFPNGLQQTVPAKTAILAETAVKPDFYYAAENVLRRTPWVKPKADPFVEKRVIVPHKVAPVAESHEPPPLVFPFEYVGKLIADGKETLFLSKGNQIYPIAEGEILENLFRVEHISSDSIEVSYIPDARKLNIALGTITGKPTAGTGVPQQIRTQPPDDSKEITTDLQQMIASPALSTAEGGQQQSAVAPVPPTQTPETMPPGMRPPRMMPPGMMLPGVSQ